MPRAAATGKAYDWTIADMHFRMCPLELLRGTDPHPIEPIPFLPPQYSTGESEFGIGDVNREAEIPVSQDEFSGGISKDRRFGKDTQDKVLWSKGMDTSAPSVGLLPGPRVNTLGTAIVGEPTKAVQKGTVTYVAAGRYLYQITSATNIEIDTDFGAGQSITDMVVFDDKLIVGFGPAGQDVRYRVSNAIAAAFTTLTGIKAQFLAISEDQLWRATDTRVFSTDNVNGPWAGYDVGDTAYTITSLVIVNRRIHVGKQDGPHVIEEDGRSWPLIPELRKQAYAYMAWNAFNWEGDYVFRTRHSLLHISSARPGEGSQITSMGLDEAADPAAPGGQLSVFSLATDGRFLYGLIDQDENPSPVNGVYIYKWDRKKNLHNYIWREDLGRTAPLLFCSAMLGSNDFKNAVLFAYQSGGSWQVAWAHYPVVTDPTQDGAYAFDATGTSRLRTLDYTAGISTVEKVTDRLKVVADDLSLDAAVDVYSHEDSEAARKIATFKVSPEEDRRLLRAMTYNRISLELRMKAGSATDQNYIQKVRGIYMPAVFLTRVVRKHTVHLVAMDHTPLVTGGRRSPKHADFIADIDKLRELRKTKVVVDCEDEDGRRFRAYLGELSEHTLYKREGPSFDPTKVVTVVLREVEF